MLVMVNARVARGTRRFQEALDIALAYKREHPDWTAAISVANACRYLGNLTMAVAYFRRALTIIRASLGSAAQKFPE